jgi:hypothetical protein
MVSSVPLTSLPSCVCPMARLSIGKRCTSNG